MSLDVYLTLPGVNQEPRDAIFIRENGRTREIARDEWNQLYPDLEPVTVRIEPPTNGAVFDYNITHNLNSMAAAAGIYQHLWRPEELGITKAIDLIVPLCEGLKLLKSQPDRFKALNPSNGWGDYDGLVKFVEKYLAACATYPDADVSVCR